MQHVKNCLSDNKTLQRLKEKLADNGDKKALRALLSESQLKEIVSINQTKDGYIVYLKSAYALYGIRAALRNFHQKVRLQIQKV